MLLISLSNYSPGHGPGTNIVSSLAFTSISAVNRHPNGNPFKKLCGNCSSSYVYEVCFADGKLCNNCNKQNYLLPVAALISRRHLSMKTVNLMTNVVIVAALRAERKHQISRYMN